MRTKKVYEKAIEAIKKNSSKHGFYASSIKKANYKRIWSRDGVIQGLAGLMAGDKEIIETLKQNLITLKKYQDETGRIASNIGVEEDDVSYGRLVGKVDASIWYVIGVGQYYKYSKDKKFLKEFLSGNIAGLITGIAGFLFIMLFADLQPGRPEVTYALAVAVLMAVWWITEAIPIAATSLLPVAMFPLLGVADGGAVSSAYFNHIIFLFINVKVP